MRSKRRSGLLWKLMLLMFSVAVALLSGAILAEWRLSLSLVDARARGIGENVAHRLGVSLKQPVTAGDSEFVQTILAGEGLSPMIERIVIFTPAMPTAPFAEYVKSGAANRNGTLYAVPDFEIVDADGGGVCCTVRVYINKDVVASNLFNVSLNNFLKGVIQVAILTVIVSLLLNHFMIHPMNRLNRLIEAIRRVVRAGYLHEGLSAAQTDAQIRRIPLYFSELQDMGYGLAELANAFYERQISLEDSEERLTTILNSIGDGVMATDDTGHITRLNPAAMRLLGVTEAEAMGKHYADFYKVRTDLSSEPLTPLVEYILRTGKPAERNGAVILTSADGVEYHVTGIASPILAKDGRVTGCVMSIHDNTGAYRLEAQMKNVQKMDLVGKLASGLTHDLNNLIGGVNGAAELLQTTPLTEKQQEYLGLITRATHSMTELMQDLLGFARTEKRESKQLSLNRIVRDAAALIQPSVSGVEVRRKLCPYHITVEGDATQLQNVFLNIGLNARDAMPNGGTLGFTTELVRVPVQRSTASGLTLSPGMYALVRIDDTGHGIPATVLQRMFEPFYTTKERGHGTGLGLSIVYSVVKEHEGAIDVKTRTGTGTVFEVYIPIVSATPDNGEGYENTDGVPALASGSPLSEISTPQAVAEPCVLLIDDDFLIRRLASAVLSEHGYRSDEAIDARDGIEKAMSGRYALIFVDLLMPGFLGNELVRMAREGGIQTPFVLVSGLDETDQRVAEALSYPDVRFLKKPFEFRTMMKFVTAFVPRPENPEG